MSIMIFKKARLAGVVLGVFMATAGFDSWAETAHVAQDLDVPVYKDVTGTYNLAHGFGLIYGPMPVTRYLGALEKMFPNAKITWRDIFTTSQQRDAMLSGNLDYGSCSVGPFMTAWDKGVDWKWLQTTSGFDGYLTVKADGPKKVEDFIGTSMKISPGPNTAQFFAVQKYLKDHGKDVHALDTNWANLPHPDAMQALIAGQLTAHFSTADFALREQEMGMKKLTSFRAIYGQLYPVGACTLTKTIQKHPVFSKGYAELLRLVVGWMNKHKDLAAVVMSKSTAGRESAANFEKYMKSDIYASYSTNADLQDYAKSLQSLGAIQKLPKQASDLYAYPELAGDKW